MADTKLLVVIGGGLLVGAGAFAAYFLFGNRAMEKDAAQKPILEWETHWQEARECLVGKDPHEADPRDTLAIEAMMGELGGCSLADLGRPEGLASGIDEIEAAWTDEDKAWHALVKAQGDSEAMGAQIDALDQVDAALRAGAGLPEAPPRRGSAKIADLALGPPAAGTGGLEVDALEARGHALVGTIGGNAVIVRGPGDLVVRRDAFGAMRAWPDPSWGVGLTILDEDAAVVSVGPIGDDGALGTPTTIVTKGKDVVNVVAAIGGGAARAIVVRLSGVDDNPLALIRSTDGGAHWGKPDKVPGSWQIATQDKHTGASAIAGKGAADGSFAWLFFDAATAVARPVAAIGEPDTSRTCFADALWYGTTDDERAVARASVDSGLVPPVMMETRGELVACTKDVVAVRVGSKAFGCSATACDAGLDLPAARDDGVIDVFDGGGVVYATQAARMIGVWRTGVEPRFVRAPAGAKLVGVAVWNKTPTFAFATAQGLRLAPLP